VEQRTGVDAARLLVLRSVTDERLCRIVMEIQA
jgi:hypothetical protein